MKASTLIAGGTLLAAAVAFSVHAQGNNTPVNPNKTEAKCGNGTAKCPPPGFLEAAAAAASAASAASANDSFSKCDVKPGAFSGTPATTAKFGCGKK